MASAVASKGIPVPLSVLLKKLLADPSPVGARRVFNSWTAAPLGRYEDDDDDEVPSDNDEEDAVYNNSPCRARSFHGPKFFASADLDDPFGAPTTLSKVLSKAKGVASPHGWCWWVAKDDKEAMTLMVPLPGLGKEHVKVWADKNMLMIKGEGDKKKPDDYVKGEGDKKKPDDDVKGEVDKKKPDDDVKGEVDKKKPDDDDVFDGGYEVRYSRRIELPADAFAMDKLRAEMKNGLLTVTVPKIKEEERKDVFHVTVE